MSDSDSLLTNHTKDESEKALSKGKLSWNDGTRSDSMNSSAEIPDSGDEEESVVRPRNMKKYIDLSESESEADSIREPSNVSDELSNEECFESRALSPRTRMSITGFRPRDLSEGESDVYDDIYEESVNTLEKSSLKKENVGDMCNEKNSSLQGIIAVTPILSNVQFPSARMSTEFNYSVGGKLSSTVMNKGSPENAISLSSESDSSVNIHSSTPARPLKLIQPRIIEIFDSPRKKETNFKNTVEYVSKEFMDNEVKKLNELQSDLATCEKLCETLSSKLPDKGKRMSGRGERLREAIAALSLSISNLRVKNEENPKKENNNLPGPTWEELTDAANSIQPKYTGKVGMANFMTQKTLTIDRLKDIHGSLESCPGENVLADEPKYLNVPLMQHQRHALAWMYWREKQRPRGGILADDMGLGKTLSMISLILASKQKKNGSN